ncbi:MAG: hypothetical protein GYA23_07185 [Methanomicrobiales archaeon]|nr:hypothetical protein [Methanomicrobiales archaeon]
MIFLFMAAVLVAGMTVIPVSAVDLKNMTDEERAAFMDTQPRVGILSDLDPAHLPPGWDTPCSGECIPIIMIFSPGDKIRFHGENTASGTTYLFLSGPGLDEKGAQIQKPDPANSPVESGNPATFAQADVGSDHTWSWTWDTTGMVLKDGTYEVLAASHPNGFDTGQAVTARGYFKIMIKNSPGTTTTPVTTAPPIATAKPVVTETIMPGVVTIRATGSQDYNLGDEINFTGTNTAGWKTYLFITGPGLAASGSQIHVTDPKNRPVISDNAQTFKQMDVQGDRTWIWRWGTATTTLDPGTYTIYAAAGPKDADNLDRTPYGTVTIRIKKREIPATASLSETTRPMATMVPAPSATMMAPTQSPGYGFLVALAGLGAAACVLFRRTR